MFCPRCGKNIDENLTVCPFCNSSIGSNANSFFKVPDNLMGSTSPLQAQAPKTNTSENVSNTKNAEVTSGNVTSPEAEVTKTPEEHSKKPEPAPAETSVSENVPNIPETKSEIEQPASVTKIETETKPEAKQTSVPLDLNIPDNKPFEIPAEAKNAGSASVTDKKTDTEKKNADSKETATPSGTTTIPDTANMDFSAFTVPKEKKPKTPKPPKKAHLLASLICLIVSFALVVSSSVYMIISSPSTPKASAATYTAKLPSSTSGEMEYDDSVAKPAPDTSYINNLEQNKADTDQSRSEIAVIEAAIAEAETTVKETYPEITKDNLSYYLNEVSNKLSVLNDENKIEDYRHNYSSNCIVVELNNGGKYVYAPSIPGVNSGAKPDLKIATYQPMNSDSFYKNYPKFSSYTDDGAQLIADAISDYKFSTDTNYDEGKVDLFSCSMFGGYNIILWDGHGCYSDTEGPLLVLGIERTADNDLKFNELLSKEEMLYGNGCYYITHKFITNRIKDDSLDNAIVYLGACESGRTDVLANAFLNKGAEAVYAATGSINTKYNAEMIKAVCEGLVKNNAEGSLNNVEQALEYAKTMCGDSDKDNVQIKLFTNNNGFSLDWYKDAVIAERDIILVVDGSGSMSGNPNEQTKTASKKFIDTVLAEQNVRVALVSFSSRANTLCNFTNRKDVLYNQIDKIYQGGSTNTYDALETANKLIDSSNAKKKILVLMSDGQPDNDSNLVSYSEDIKNKGVFFYTLGFFHKLSSNNDRPRMLMKNMASENGYYDVSNAEDLVFFFGDIANVINGQKYIYIEIACPVDVKVSKGGEVLNSDSDDLSTHSSFGTLSVEKIEDTEEDDNYDDDDEDEEIEMSSSILNINSNRFSDEDTEDESENTKKILRLKDGIEYDIQIEGTGSGTMDYTIQYMDDNGDYSDKREFKNINITPKTEIATVAASTAKETTLSVDNDGDGKYDQIYRATSNSKGQLYDDILYDISFYVLIIFSILLVLSLAAFVILTIKKKNYQKSLNPAE